MWKGIEKMYVCVPTPNERAQLSIESGICEKYLRLCDAIIAAGMSAWDEKQSVTSYIFN
jgi:hypothetical protein